MLVCAWSNVLVYDAVKLSLEFEDMARFKAVVGDETNSFSCLFLRSEIL